MVTLKDIARLSGVNAGSVSHILTNSPKALELKEETRARVQVAARELGYHRNEHARIMRGGSSQIVGLVCDFQPLLGQNLGIYVNRIMNGVLQETTANNYGVKLYDAANYSEAISSMESYQVRHIVVPAVHLEARRALSAWANRKGLHLVFVMDQPVGEYPCVNSADRTGVYKGVKRLLSLGHQRIGLISSPLSYYYARERHAGYVEALQEAGVEFDPSLVSYAVEAQEHERNLDKQLSFPCGCRPTAFMSLGDYSTLLLQRRLVLSGYLFPEDYSVISFGDGGLSQYAIRPLTFVAQPFEAMGRSAVRLSLGIEKNPLPASGIMELPTELCIGESDGPLRR